MIASCRTPVGGLFNHSLIELNPDRIDRESLGGSLNQPLIELDPNQIELNDFRIDLNHVRIELDPRRIEIDPCGLRSIRSELNEPPGEDRSIETGLSSIRAG